MYTQGPAALNTAQKQAKPTRSPDQCLNGDTSLPTARHGTTMAEGSGEQFPIHWWVISFPAVHYTSRMDQWRRRKWPYLWWCCNRADPLRGAESRWCLDSVYDSDHALRSATTPTCEARTRSTTAPPTPPSTMAQTQRLTNTVPHVHSKTTDRDGTRWFGHDNAAGPKRGEDFISTVHQILPVRRPLCQLGRPAAPCSAAVAIDQLKKIYRAACPHGPTR
jgi:hypothetical protein